MRPNEFRALALVLEYETASMASREPFLVCCADDCHDEGSCYQVWKHSGRNGLFYDLDRFLDTLTRDEAAKGWCESCQQNEAIYRRRATAKKARGAVLRNMLRLARRVER